MSRKGQVPEDLLESSGYLEACEIVEGVRGRAVQSLQYLNRIAASGRVHREKYQSALYSPPVRDLNRDDLKELSSGLMTSWFLLPSIDRVPSSIESAMKHLADAFGELGRAFSSLRNRKQHGAESARHLKWARRAALAADDIMVGAGIASSQDRVSLARHVRRWGYGWLHGNGLPISPPDTDASQDHQRDQQQLSLHLSTTPGVADSGGSKSGHESVENKADSVICHQCGAAFPPGSDAVFEEPEYESSHQGRPTCEYCGEYL